MGDYAFHLWYRRLAACIHLNDPPPLPKTPTGIGDGPLRELLDALRPLFGPERPLAFHEPASTSSNGGLLTPFLPLFRRLEHQGDADAVGPRPSPSPPLSRNPLPTEWPALRQEEKGGEATTAAAAESGGSGGDSSDSSNSSSKPAIPIPSVGEEASKEDKKGRHLLLRVAGRVLGFALRNGMPLGVVIPPTVCRALLDLDDPSVPKQQLELPPSPPVVTAAVGPGAPAVDVAVAMAAAKGEEEGKQQEEVECAAPAGGGGQGSTTTTNNDNRRGRRGRRGGKGAKAAANSEEKPPPPPQQQQAKQPPSPTGTRSVAVPVGRWRELVGEDDPVLLRSLEALLVHDFDRAGPDDPLADTRFVVTEEGEEEGEDGSGTMREVELVPGGARLRVTDANKQAFVALVARRRLLRGAEGEELRALKSVSYDIDWHRQDWFAAHLCRRPPPSTQPNQPP